MADLKQENNALKKRLIELSGELKLEKDKGIKTSLGHNDLGVLKLTYHARKRLEASGITTIADLIKVKRTDLALIKGLGTRLINEIVTKAKLHGIEIG